VGHKRIEIYYRKNDGHNMLMMTTDRSPTLKHAKEVYIEALEKNDQLYRSEALAIGEQLVYDRINCKHWDTK